jgi:hypothetical protein
MTKTKDKIKKGTLQVWWIPQVPGKAFTVIVPDLKTASILLDTLANYDMFQLENHIKPDYSNAGGLNIWDDNMDGEGNPGWVTWHDPETDDEFDDYRAEHFK